MHNVNIVTEHGRPFIVIKAPDAAWVADPVFGRVTMTSRRRYWSVIRDRLADALSYGVTNPPVYGTGTGIYLRNRLIREGITSVGALMSARAMPYRISVTIGDQTISATSVSGSYRWYAPWSPLTMSTAEAVAHIAKRARHAEPPTAAYRAIQEVEGILAALHLKTPIVNTIAVGPHTGWSLVPYGIEIINADGDTVRLRAPSIPEMSLYLPHAIETAAGIVLDTMAWRRVA